jgi:hypothetical protein
MLGLLTEPIQQADSSIPSGIDESRVTNASDHQFTMTRAVCPICLNIIWKLVSCAGCHANYCKACIDWYITSQRQKGVLDPLCTGNGIYIADVNPILAELLQKLNISCIYCNESYPYDGLEKHEIQCCFNQIACPSCGELYLRKNVLEHDKSCLEKLILLGCCSTKMKRKDVSGHDEVNCLKSQLSEAKTRITRLEQALTGKEDQIFKSKQALEEKDYVILDLKKALSDNEYRTSNLRTTSADKDYVILDLKQALSDNEYQISNLKKASADKDSIITGLNLILDDKMQCTNPTPMKKLKTEDKSQKQIAIANVNNDISLTRTIFGLPTINNTAPTRRLPHMCTQGHELQLLSLKARGLNKFQCELCKTSYQGVSWHCGICWNYDICSTCMPMPVTSNNCLWGHKMVKVKVSPILARDCYCHYCYKPNIVDFQLYCEKCKYHQCGKCA